MLFLLRKIRRKLLTDNKVMTYVLYAIGEIILVVVGILIAVSIDNWSQYRTDRKQEQAYLQNLKEDLQKDLGLYNSYMTNNQRVFEMIDSLSNSLKSPNRQDHAAKSIYWGRMITMKWMRVEPVERTYEQMKSSGQLKLISNKMVADQISDYYNSIYQLNTYNDAALIWLENYIDKMGKIFDGGVLFEILKNRKMPASNAGIFITDNYAQINELITSAQYVFGALQLSETITAERKVAAESLIELLNQEYLLD